MRGEDLMPSTSDTSGVKISAVEHLFVYNSGFDAAMTIFVASKGWPAEEKWALTSQIRQSSRSVCANISEAWGKRRYPAHFVSKLTDAHSEAEETCTWLRFAAGCGYMSTEQTSDLLATYRQIIAGLLAMIHQPGKWCLPNRRPRK